MFTYRKTFSRIVCVVLLCALVLTFSEPVDSVGSVCSKGYASSIFYRRLCNVRLSGDARSDIVQVAMSQVGYTEGNNKNQYSGLYGGSKNYTEYGLWYETSFYADDPQGYNHAAWCASFVSWCAYQAGISSDIVYYHAYTPQGYNWYNSHAKVYSRSAVEQGTYTPQPGDIVYFKSNWNNNKVNHVGIVVRYTDGVLYTVEGNTSSGAETSDGGCVCLKSYSIGNTFIRYICCPNY